MTTNETMAVRLGAFFHLGWMALLGMALAPAVQATDRPATTDEEKTHAVFVGLSVSAQVEGQPRRIMGISRSHAEIDTDGRVTRVRREKLGDLSFEREPKVSKEVITVGELKIERGFRMGGAVDQAWDDAQRARRLGEKLKQLSNRADVNNVITPGQKLGGMDFVTHGSDATALDDMATQHLSFGDIQYDDVINQAKDAEQFDAVDVSFRISSPRKVNDCYIVVLCEIEERGKASQASRAVFFRDIGTIDQEPRNVSMQFGGLAPGFRLRRTEVHLYSGGRELASNVAPNCVMLTEPQATDFMVLLYIGSNKEKTLPAQVFFAPALSDALKQIEASQKERRIKLEIDTTGKVARVSAKGGITKEIESYLRDVRFYPALEAGKAIATSLEISFADLFAHSDKLAAAW